MNKRQCITRTSLVLLGILLGLIILELFSRFYLEKMVVQSAIRDYRDADKNFIKYFQLSDTVGFEPIGEKPNNARLSQQNLNDHVLGIISEKYKRIVIIGDSITHRGTFSNLLQNMIDNQKNRGDSAFEVISFGIESYNTAQEEMYIRSRWSTLKPDILILQFSLNDFEYPPVVAEIDGRITYLSAQREPAYEPLNALFKTSSLYRFMIYKTLLGETKYDEAGWERRKNSVRTALINVKQLSATYRIPFVVIVFPLFADQQPEPEYSSILSILKEISVPYINLLPIFESYENLASFAGFENGAKDIFHPNGTSQQIIANALYKYIDQLGILKSNLGSN